ncbi:MAG: MerR family transcriptional regulator [Acidimicrobiia bacterium]|jgi:DNA-binding transcriptional MerR regulator
MSERWRIDDLAHETGITVDTIRYYQRQGLLPPGEREGRHRIYGDEHVRRLRRIKELQARRFSIAAIHALVAGDGNRLDGVFADDGESLRLTFDELLERSGASRELAAGLEEAGVLRDPLAFGRTAYDGDDVEMLRGMARLVAAGVPPSALAKLGKIYAEGIEQTQRRVVDVFVSGGGLEWGEGELDQLRVVAAADSKTLLPAMRRLVDYTHHRTIQRLTLDAVQRGTFPDPDAVDPDATEELAITPGAEDDAD